MSAYARLAAELATQPRRWLVTGAAGFIGSHLVERLLALGQSVVGLDDFSSGTRARLAAVERAVGAQRWARFELVEGDVRDEACVRGAARGAAHVLHQAGVCSVPRSLREPERVVAVNAGGTWSVLAAARAAGARGVVFASSSSVYGDCKDTPQREERIGRALSPYAASKQAAELAAAGVSRALGFPSVALRYFNVFGPRQDPEGPYAAVIPRWGAALLAGQAPVLEGDGRQTRDFTPVASVVEANLLAACGDLPEPAAVLNVGTGRETSLLTLLAQLRELAAELGRPRAELVELGPVAAPARPDDRRASCADVARARAWIGYEPPAELLPALRATLRSLVDSPARAS